MRDPHLTENYPEYPAFACGRRGRGGGFGSGGGVERKWKRVAEKEDNEGRKTQIGQNNILVGRFV